MNPIRRMLAAILLLGLLLQPSARAEQPSVEDVLSAIVRVKMQAVKDARTASYLGDSREGTGVVIDDKGHVLTIGYLIIEADSIELTSSDGRTIPATVAAYDHATGFGLLRPTVPIAAHPIPLGDSARLKEREPVMIVPHGGRESASMAYVVSRREFTGSWEYLLDSAIFTSPPTSNWSGSALVDREGRLVGVGSLFVRNSAAEDELLPGNLFVPIDLLKPILADLIGKGRSPGPPRPWLGLSTDELQGRLFVTRVSQEGPAAQAGIKRGDIVIGIGEEAVTSQADFYRKLWTLGPAGIEVPLKLLQGASVSTVRVKSIDRLTYFRGKSTY